MAAVRIKILRLEERILLSYMVRSISTIFDYLYIPLLAGNDLNNALRVLGLPA